MHSGAIVKGVLNHEPAGIHSRKYALKGQSNPGDRLDDRHRGGHGSTLCSRRRAGHDPWKTERCSAKTGCRNRRTASFVIGALEDPQIPAKLIAETIARFRQNRRPCEQCGGHNPRRIEDTEAETFDRTLAINLRAPLFLIQAALPHFRKQGGGRVLNIGSINALLWGTNYVGLFHLQGWLDDSDA